MTEIHFELNQEIIRRNRPRPKASLAGAAQNAAQQITVGHCGDAGSTNSQYDRAGESLTAGRGALRYARAMAAAFAVQ